MLNLNKIAGYDVHRFLREARGVEDPALARARAHLVRERHRALLLEVLSALLEYERSEAAA